MAAPTPRELQRIALERYGIELDERLAGMLAEEVLRLDAALTTAMADEPFDSDPFGFAVALRELRRQGE